VYEEARNLIRIMENQTIPPSNDRARQRAMREAIASNEECGRGRKEPDVHKVQNGSIVAEVKHEVMPRAPLVLVDAHREKVESLEGVRDVDPSSR
jgi:hypothetical protein